MSRFKLDMMARAAMFWSQEAASVDGTLRVAEAGISLRVSLCCASCLTMFQAQVRYLEHVYTYAELDLIFCIT
jgi:hypothetical protein